MKNVGLGRIGFLKSNIKISEIVSKLKALLNQNTFRLALANGMTISKRFAINFCIIYQRSNHLFPYLDDKVGVLAVGAGSGTDLLSNQIGDFIITGELTHHDILNEVHRGTSVLITDHSNTERGFIHVFKKDFLELLEKNDETVDILISETDHDPIAYV